MKTIKTLLFAVVISFAFLAGRAAAQEIAKLESYDGEVEIKTPASSGFQPIQLGQSLNVGDVVRTGKYCRASLQFADGSILRLASNTILELKGARGASAPAEVSIPEGKGFFFSREEQHFPTISTPAVSTAIRGTEFAIEVTKNKTLVSLFQGAVDCFNAQGSVSLKGGEAALTEIGKAPVKQIILNPKDAVQWALAYPETLSSTEVSALRPKNDASRAMFDRAVSLQKQGKIQAALTELEDFRGERTSGIALLQSSLYLSVGEVEKASALLSRIPEQDVSASSTALSQRALIDLVNNDKESARRLAAEALSKSPDNSSAQLVSGMVSQAFFDLDDAKQHYVRVSTTSGSPVFALSRLAELELGGGDPYKAQEYISRALALAPTDAMALTVQGFIHLVLYETEKAKSDFQKAIASDSSLALARLGLGLTVIRQGDLEGGTAYIKQATALEPNVAVYRSYLGKAFFEEEREGQALEEYAQAVRLDPNDPTPYLYRSYAHLSQNRPVAALRDIQTSIAKNDARAVYRSSLLLDQDLAVRGASLADTFNTLGFSEAARVEAIKSISKDYTNHSAHLLLAESYNTIRLADSGFSERKIANILAPLSFNVFQRGAQEFNLNDYNAFFDRQQNRTQLNTTIGTLRDLINNGVAHAGKTEQFGYLMSYDNSNTNGSREKNYGREHTGRTFLQYQPTYEDRISFEATGNYSHIEDDQSSPRETRFNDYNLDLGYNRRIDKNSKLIVQTSFTNRRNDFIHDLAFRQFGLDIISNGELTSNDADALVDEFNRERTKALRGTMQYLYDSNTVSFLVGGQLYGSDIEREETSRIRADSTNMLTDLDLLYETAGYNDLFSQDYYTYSTWHLASWADLDVGVNYSILEIEDQEVSPFLSDTSNRHKLAPKVGLTLTPTNTTLIRAAYFETLRKSSLEDVGQLEPTLVGGINQRFTDLSGSRASNIGFGIDQKISSETYFGVEAIRRHIVKDLPVTTPFLSVDTDQGSIDSFLGVSTPIEIHSDENFFKTYLYQVLTDELSAALDYQYADNDRTTPAFPQQLQLHRAGAGLRYFSPYGWFTFAKGTWREQDRSGSDFFIDGNSDFWVLDAAIGYRIPKRHGQVALRFNNILDEGFDYDQSVGVDDIINDKFNMMLVASFNF